MPIPTDVIHRYEIPIDDQPHRFTIGRGPLYFACRQGDRVEFWAYAPTESSAMDREFTIIGTGQPLPLGTWHVGTVLSPSGNLVWHILEVAQPGQWLIRQDSGSAEAPKVATTVTVHNWDDSAQVGAEIARSLRRQRRDGGI
ncbi:hypothetical protein AB0K87_01690 [Streptomyces sp. NPDC053705]|uniref:DUF7352 domain-containing protein n=1 Tax=Streptomyces TaxID=1883 RepID=UPI00343BCF59